MPELPEVESLRRGVAAHLPGRRVLSVTVRSPRSVRDQPGGAAGLRRALEGARFGQAHRRGKYLWVELDRGTVLLMHMRMSGQLRIDPVGAPEHRHQHITVRLDNGQELRFVDQRTFGGWQVDHLVEVHGAAVPSAMRHIGPDLLELGDRPSAGGVIHAVMGLTRSRRALKTLLLDQGIISGIGNIYADEMLWRAGIAPTRPGTQLSAVELTRLLACGREVMERAIAAGGTSFDALYVHVNGQSGYFARELDAYGRAGQPCHRCTTTLERIVLAGRSTTLCPRCQV